MARAAADVLGGADAVVPVPLHPARALQRGFNQADDLARALGLPVWRILRRRRYGPAQAQLPVERRRENVQCAFAIRRLALARRAEIRHRILVLVDDVMTTGETIEACSEALLAAGAGTVMAVTVARAVAERPPPPPWPRPLSTVPHQ